jgi:hypothetical protein
MSAPIISVFNYYSRKNEDLTMDAIKSQLRQFDVDSLYDGFQSRAEEMYFLSHNGVIVGKLEFTVSNGVAEICWLFAPRHGEEMYKYFESRMLARRHVHRLVAHVSIDEQESQETTICRLNFFRKSEMMRDFRIVSLTYGDRKVLINAEKKLDQRVRATKL